MDFDVVFMTGPQGCGKGTQGKLLAKKLDFTLWGMGGVLRQILSERSPLAEKISAINDGTLLSDEIIIEVLKERLPAVLSEKGIIFDGVPRRMGQAKYLIDVLKASPHHGRMATVYLEIPREESVRRLLLRAQTEGRADDTLEGIQRRLEYFEEIVKPMFEYLRQETTFLEVDGTRSVEEVAESVNKVLGIA